MRAGVAPTVFDYSDYRTYLKDFYAHLKRGNPRLSYEAFAKRIGLFCNSSIIKVIQGKRDAGEGMINRFISAFSLSEREGAYLYELVKLSKNQMNNSKYVSTLERLRDLHPGKTFRLLSDSEFSVISNWWCYAIRQMTRLPSFSSEPEFIVRLLKYPCRVSQVRAAIENLLELGLLRRNEKTNQLVVTGRSLKTTSNIASEGLKRFHDQMLSNAQTAIRKVDVSERFLTGFTVGISMSRYSEATRALDEFLEKFAEEFESTHPDEVYQVQVQFFPLTRSREIKRKGES